MVQSTWMWPKRSGVRIASATPKIMKKVIFIHGYRSSPKKKKYQIIAEELSKLGVDFSIPALPGGDYPHSKEWLEIINKEVKSSRKPLVLVGHSLGTRAVPLYLDKYNQKVDTVILFAAFNNNDFAKNRQRRNGNYADFFEYALDIDKIKKLAKKFVVIHSKDDESIDYQQGVEISQALGAELITYENMGHFSGDERAEENAKVFLKIVRPHLI